MTLLRRTLRLIAHRPGFASAVVFCTALGVAATTAIFSLLYQVVLKPLPYDNPQQLVTVWETKYRKGSQPQYLSADTFLDLMNESTVFRAIGAFRLTDVAFTGIDRPEWVSGATVTPGFLSEVLRVRPLRGRTFSPDEQGQVVVLSHGFWLRRFGGEPAVVGRSMLLDGQPHDIIGVLPDGFVFENPEPDLLKAIDIWRPFSVERYRRFGRGLRFLRIVARLRSNITLTHAQNEIAAIASHIEEQHPNTNAGYGILLIPLHQRLVAHIQRELWFLFAAVGLMLLILTINLASLFLARTIENSADIAVSAALGAKRYHIVKQIASDSVMLSLAGGLLALFLAGWIRSVLLHLSPIEVPRAHVAEGIGTIILSAVGLSILAGILSALPPSVQAVRAMKCHALRQSRGNIGYFTGARLRTGLITVELATAMALLVCGALLTKSFWKVTSLELGFQPRGILRVGLNLPRQRYQDVHRIAQFYHQLEQRLPEITDVKGVGFVKDLPLTGNDTVTEVTARIDADTISHELSTRIVSSGYFLTMGIPIIDGRVFTPRDADTDRHAVVVNEAFIREVWAGSSPLGKSLTVNWFGQELAGMVVGVVGDVRHRTPDQPPAPAIYLDHRQLVYPSMNLVIKTSRPPRQLIPALRTIISDLDSDLPLHPIEPLSSVVSRATSRRRFFTILIASFAVLGLILSFAGLFSGIAYSVSQRTQEVGIRMALGARPGTVLREILRPALFVTIFGLTCGVAAAAAASRMFHRLLYDVTPLDPGSIGAAAAVFAIITLLACYLPARRASRLDAATALRHE